MPAHRGRPSHMRRTRRATRQNESPYPDGVRDNVRGLEVCRFNASYNASTSKSIYPTDSKLNGIKLSAIDPVSKWTHKGRPTAWFWSTMTVTIYWLYDKRGALPPEPRRTAVAQNTKTREGRSFLRRLSPRPRRSPSPFPRLPPRFQSHVMISQ